MHLHEFIRDFAFVLLFAGIIGIIFKKLSWPSSLGYLLSGFLLGPNVPHIPSIANQEVIKVWAEFGIIFVFFYLGLELNMKKFSSIGQKGLITTLIEVPGTFTIGFLTGQFLGFTTIENLFLGGMLCISSTTIILKSFEDMKLKDHSFSQKVIGNLIFEDIAAITLLIILSTVSITQKFSGTELTASVAKMIFFFIITFILGILLVPSIFKAFKKALDNESIIIMTCGLCFIGAVAASSFGLSIALGAFLMGMVFSNLEQTHKIEELVLPLRDIFTSIFFVSIGVLVNPIDIYNHWQIILGLSFLVIFSKIAMVFMGNIISGSNLTDATRASFSMAQIGEFSFIIATMGVSLKVIPYDFYTIAVGVSIITTILTPILIKTSDKTSKLLESNLPQKLKVILKNYNQSTFFVLADIEQRRMVKNYILRLIVLSNFCIAVLILNHKFQFELNQLIPAFGKDINFFISLVCTAPIYWGLIGGRINYNIKKLKTTKTLLIHYIMNMTRYLIVLTLVTVQFSIFLPNKFISLGMLALFVIILKFFSNKFDIFYNWIERKVINTVKTQEEQPTTKSIKASMQDLSDNFERITSTQLRYIDVPADFRYLGKRFEELKLREVFGVNIALIQRGEHVEIPQGKTQILPYDKLAVLSTDEQFQHLSQYISESKRKSIIENEDITNYGLHPVTIGPESKIKDSSIKELFHGKNLRLRVLGYQKADQRMQVPDAEYQFSLNDVVWFLAKRVELEAFLENPFTNQEN